MNKLIRKTLSYASYYPLALLSFSTEAVDKVLLYKLEYSALGGYVSAPPSNWSQQYTGTVADKSGAMLVVTKELVNYHTSSTPPDPAYLTYVTGKGSISSKEMLPVQITGNDCTNINYSADPPKYNACPSQYVEIERTPFDKKYNVTMWHQVDNGGTNYYTSRSVYMLDLNYAVGNQKRWTPILLKANDYYSNIQMSPTKSPAYYFIMDQTESTSHYNLYSIR